METAPGEYNGASVHRHTGGWQRDECTSSEHPLDRCKAHRFCIAERIEESVPAKESLPQPLPFTIRPMPDEPNYLEVSRHSQFKT